MSTLFWFLDQESTYTYKATFETAASGLRADTDMYLNVDATKEVTMGGANNTPGGSRVIRMSTSYKSGPAFVLRMLPGDKVDAEVWASFEGTDFNSQASLNTMIAAVAGAYGGVSGAGGESGAIYDNISTAMNALGLPTDAGSTVPNAYLNFIFLDELPGFNKVSQFDDGGYKPVPADAYQSKKKLALAPFTAKKPGYLYIYLTFEEENTSYYVHFDDLKITYTPSRIIQATDYYPFGASHSTSWTRETATPNPYLYNAGAEKNDKTGWYETFYRSYDPYLGRFSSIDIMADTYSSFNSYNYSLNSSVVFNDPLGDDARDPKRGNNWWSWRDSGPQDASSAKPGSVAWNNSTYGSGSPGGSAYPIYGPGDGGALSSFASYMSAGAHAAKFNSEQSGYITIDQYLLGSNGTMVGDMWVFQVSASIGYESHSQPGFFSGVADGFGGGVGSTVNFLKSLSTKEGWQSVGQGMMNVAMMANTMSPQGAVLRGQVAQSTTNYVTNIPNMSAYEMGYDLGFGAEKVAEAVLLSKGSSLAGSAIRGAGSAAGGATYSVETIAGYYVRGSSTLAKGTYTRTIQSLASLSEGTSITKLLKGLEAEARASGANKLVLNGIGIVETRLINAQAAQRLGYSFKQTSNNSIQLTKILQ